MIQAPAFSPTPSTLNTFNTALRSNRYLAAGVIPLWKIIKNLQLRTEFYAFVPIQPIYEDSNNKAYYGKSFEQINFFGEASVVYSLPWASLSIYGNYLNNPKPQWNFGVMLGIQLFAPQFIN